MEDRIRNINLYDYYYLLLTDKQQTYFEEYYFNNLSLQEISELYSVSRNAIYKTIKDVCLKLEEYENNLKLYEKGQKLKKIIDEVDDEELKGRLSDILW